jgi:protein tyrosine/serine phosphatase
MRSAELTEFRIIEALKAINNAEKPVLVHCWHGSDRTGVVVAAYRIVFENWTKEAAISEFRNSDFGYHENWYPNLIDLLENLNTEDIRKQLGME